MSNQTPSPGPSEPAQALKKQREKLRQATFILPKTGQRVKRSITLRGDGNGHPGRPSTRDCGSLASERRSLLRRQSRLDARPETTTWGRLEERAAHTYHRIHDAVTSPTGIDALKCSLAYLLGSLATFVLPLTKLLGQQDGKHMVATVTVYFHPARSAGSMSEATLLALIAFLYAAFVSFASMAVSVFFGSQNLLGVGHAVVLLVFCGGGLGLVGWLKQKLGNPLVNVACSLASLSIITILTREGSVQAAKFSYDKVFQVLRMIIMGVLFTVAVSFLVKPRSARKSLREDLVKITDLLEEFLTTIAGAFLTGSDEELKASSYTVLSGEYRSINSKLIKDLREAKFEHYVLGTEEVYQQEARLVRCIERLAQSLIGLRSAADTQFELLNEQPTAGVRSLHRERMASLDAIFSPEDHVRELPVISEEPEELSIGPSRAGSPSQNGTTMARLSTGSRITEPSDIFTLFITELGPPMKSLAYTLKEVLRELPFGPPPDYEIETHKSFRTSLVDAKDLFVTARKHALELLYMNKSVETTREPAVAADYEEVAASCGHFSSCLEDFAEDTIAYLDILEELKDRLEVAKSTRSWNWIFFWRKSGAECVDMPLPQADPRDNHAEHRQHMALPEPAEFTEPVRGTAGQLPQRGLMQDKLWHALRLLRRDDVRHAIKVGLGAVLYAMISFIPATRPTYQHWRGEWGLLSYMLVCSMTIGASNTTGLQRFLGTCIGAVTAVVVWIVSNDTPVVLCFLGWLVSLACFYIIIGKGNGPMGRFILLTYNLSCLYAYSLSIKDVDGDDDDEGGVDPAIWEIVLHRVVAVTSGCVWGLIVTRLVWPISARKQLKQGVSMLWLRMGYIWRRDPLSQILRADQSSSYLDAREAMELQRFLVHLQSLRDSATHEFELRGPFPELVWKQILGSTGKLIGAFHAVEVVIQKDLKASEGERRLLAFTRDERAQLSARISHLFSVLASSMRLQYPINDALPNVEHTRDRLLTRIFEFRQSGEGKDGVADEDYELIYTYALVTHQIAREIARLGGLVEQLYGVVDEESLRLM